MSKKILSVSSLSFLFVLILFSSGFGQSSIRFNIQRASPSEDLEYRKQFKSYTLGSLATKTTSDLLRSKGDFDVLEIDIQGKKFAFDLHARDLRSANFKLRVQDEKGVTEMPRSPNTTYYGYTLNGNYDVRITADDDFFYAMIIQSNDEFYIEPATDIVPTAPADQYVMYWSSDNLKKMNEDACGALVVPLHQIAPEGEDSAPQGPQRSLVVCKTVEIALADDHLMYNKYGSVSAVTNHNMAVINNVLTNYDDEFTYDIEFDVVEVYVATTAGNDPWTTSTDPGVLLDDFTDWGPTGFSNTHDVASLWTNRDFNGDVIGIAWIGAVCSSYRYNILQDFTNNANFLRVLQAHEMGHNFDAVHDAPNSGFIMAPSVSNTNTWSSQSLNDINAYMPNLQCLSGCSSGLPPVADFDADETEGCVPFTVHFIDQSDNNPTSWLWTFPGGNPASSTLQFPTVIYNASGSYSVTLKVTNAQGMDTLTIPNFITVGDIPFADFDYVQDELLVEFDNLSTNATSYFWNFGDGNTSTQVNPSHEYEQDGTYNVTLTATNTCGSDIITMEIEIITLPVADFDASPTEGCDPMEVEFTNLSSVNSDFFQWSFPGGSPPSSTAFEPSIVYEIPGTFSVTLTVINDAGEDVLTRTNYITLLPQANSTFTYNIVGLLVMFNSNGSVGDTYNWNFGDGQSSTAHNPSHLYDEGGVYNVTLTVTNQCGSDVQQTTISIAGAPVADFTSNLQSGCGPLIVQFINQSTGSNIQSNWVFQGGSPATSTQQNPIVTYNTPGSYDVTLTVTNAVGSDDLFINNYITVFSPTISDFDFTINGSQVNFINQSTQSTGSTWHFGDGQVSDDENPVHIYADDGVYTVTLISEGACGNDTSTAQVTIATPPTADFSFVQNGDCAPATVQYTNESSSNTTSVKWIFLGGTPSTSTQFNPLVTYSTPGTFDTRLIAFSPGGSDTMTWPQIVTIGEPSDAAFLIATNGMTVDMENQSTGSDSYLWLFGDGQTSTEINPSHTYSAFGTYTISLISMNECGNDTMSIVIVLSTVPNAFFSYDIHSGCVPMTVHFIDQSQNNPTSWLWSFDGGEPLSSTLQNPVVVYNTPGDYTVSLRVENTQGSDVLTLMDLINVAGTPDATFTHEVNGNFVSLFYQGIDYDSLRWDFGDSRTDNSLNPTVEYTTSGQYEISLTIYNACGTDTKSVIVDIKGTATDDPSINESHWQIRPNPFGDKFAIYGEPLKDGKIIITLLDVHGRMISKEEWSHSSGPSTKKLSSDHLPSGIILVHLQDGSSRVVLRGVHQD